jgi:hypothetical protein
MATPQIVSPQITDAVTSTNVTILGSVPGNALGNLFQATAQAVANAAHNATALNQNSGTVLQATTTQGVALLYGVDTAATAVGISEILGSNPAGGGGRSYP